MKYDIFISYRRSGGKDVARALKEALEKNGYSVFLDIDELKDGHFIETIYKAIDSSKVLLLVMSDDVFERCSEPGDHLRNELEYALKQKLSIIPVVLDKQIPNFPNDIPQSFYSGISSLQYSFLDTEHLFKESVNKIIKERIAPVAGRKANHIVLKWVAGVILGIVLALVVIQYYGYKDREPSYYIEAADQLAGVTVAPKSLEQIKSEVKPIGFRKILKLYRKGAEDSETSGLAAYDTYTQLHENDALDDAYSCYHNAGYAYQCLEEYPKAIENYSLAISCAMKLYGISNNQQDLSHAAYSLNNLAYCYLPNGEEDKALETIDKSIELFPDELNSYDSKGELLYLMGRYSEALAVWDEIQARDPYFQPEYWVECCKENLK